MNCFEIAIVEDNDEDYAEIENCLNAYSRMNHVILRLTRFAYGEAFLSELRHPFDIVFMDVQLRGMNGLEASRKFRENYPETVLILITCNESYAINGYEIEANDFILKPVHYALLESKLRKAINCVRANNAAVAVTISRKDSTSVIFARNICYIEIFSHSLVFHTIAEEITGYGTLNKVEEQLKDYGFARCSSCCLVNLKYVSGISGDEISLYTGDTLHMSRFKRKPFLETLARYCAEGKA